MTIAKDFASKAAVAFVAVAMIFTMFAPAARAQSTADLQAMINQLLAQIAALQAQSGTGAQTAVGTSSVCPFTWTRDLNNGATGADVMKLQQFLNSNADMRVAASGAGSVGMETQFYGPATAAAVSKMQVMYRADILTPGGLVNPTGFFGPSSRAKANALCSATIVTPVDPVDPVDPTDPTDPTYLSGEASLEVFEIDDAADDQVQEGNEDVEIGEFNVEFTDGDAEISRLDIALEKSGSDPWEAFETISLWVDGDKVAEMAADDEDEYLDEDDGTLRFTGLDIVAMEDEEVTITVAATVQNNLDAAELGDWELFAIEIRFFDADGVATTEDSFEDLVGNTTAPFTGDISASFEVEEEGEEDELTIRTSTSDPDATTIQLEDDSKSDYVTVFAFDLDTEDSINDIETTQIRVDVAATEDGTTPTSTLRLISDVQLVVDGETYDDVTITNGTPGQYLFDLDDEDFLIDAGNRVTVEFQVEFKSLPADLEGATVEATVDTDGLEAEGADDLTTGAGQLSGSATGDEHTLRTEGAILEFVSSTETKDLNSDTTAADDEGVFTLKFEVTAFENDLFVNKTAASGTTMGTAGVNFQITDGSGTVVGTTTAEASLSSTADTEGTRYKVDEGSTETFTLTVSYDPGVSGFYGLQLYSLNFNVANAAPNTQQRALPEEDYETDPLSI